MNTTLIIVAGIFFGPLIIFAIIKGISKIGGFKKTMPKMAWPKKFTFWRCFWISFLLIAVANFIYPGDWFVAKKIRWYFLPDYEKNNSVILGKVKEKEINPYKKIIADIAKKESPTQEDLEKAQKAREAVKQIEGGRDKNTTTPQAESRITVPICDDLKSGAFFAFKKPSGGSKQLTAKIVEFTKHRLLVKYSEKDCLGYLDCKFKSNGKYQGRWEESRSGKKYSGLIELESISKDGYVTYLKGNVRGEKGKVTVPCAVAGEIITLN